MHKVISAVLAQVFLMLDYTLVLVQILDFKLTCKMWFNSKAWKAILGQPWKISYYMVHHYHFNRLHSFIEGKLHEIMSSGIRSIPLTSSWTLMFHLLSTLVFLLVKVLLGTSWVVLYVVSHVTLADLLRLWLNFGVLFMVWCWHVTWVSIFL